MATKDKKVFGAPDTTEEEKINDLLAEEGVHDVSGLSEEELMEQLKADAAKKAKSRKKKRIEEYKAVQATREALFSRIGKTIDVPIILDGDTVMVFKVKRLSEADNSEILDRSLAIKDLSEMTPEELEESNDYNYRLLEKVVVEPKLTQEDWKYKVDTALVQKIVSQVMKVLTNVDDSRVFDEFQT